MTDYSLFGNKMAKPLSNNWESNRDLFSMDPFQKGINIMENKLEVTKVEKTYVTSYISCKRSPVNQNL